ncbi:MAG: hypothetical protein IH820_18030, partial [Bacteroidetes bacterium]|nr:hypothetical protein [Bacteroidota bacterium]
AEPRPATDDELGLFHERAYIDAVRAIGAGLGLPNEALYGFGPGDNPTYPGIFQAQALSACDDGARGAQDHVTACLMQGRALTHDLDHVRPVQPGGSPGPTGGFPRSARSCPA